MVTTEAAVLTCDELSELLLLELQPEVMAIRNSKVIAIENLILFKVFMIYILMVKFVDKNCDNIKLKYLFNIKKDLRQVLVCLNC